MADSADVFAALRSPQSPRTSLAAARPEDPFDPGIWNQAGFAPLHVAVAACAEAGDPEKASVVELLLRQFNVDVHVRDASGNTPLHTAAATGSGDAANLLLSAGADPFPANLDGRLPVACAKTPETAVLLNGRMEEYEQPSEVNAESANELRQIEENLPNDLPVLRGFIMHTLRDRCILEERCRNELRSQVAKKQIALHRADLLERAAGIHDRQSGAAFTDQLQYLQDENEQQAAATAYLKIRVRMLENAAHRQEEFFRKNLQDLAEQHQAQVQTLTRRCDEAEESFLNVQRMNEKHSYELAVAKAVLRDLQAKQASALPPITGAAPTKPQVPQMKQHLLANEKILAKLEAEVATLTDKLALAQKSKEITEAENVDLNLNLSKLRKTLEENLMEKLNEAKGLHDQEDKASGAVIFSNELASGNRIIKAGTKGRLIEKLADPTNYADSNFLQAFMLTYRLFMTKEEVLDELIRVYKASTSSASTYDPMAPQNPVLLRVSSALKYWMENYWRDFDTPEIRNTLSSFIDFIMENDVKTAMVLRSTLKRQESGISVETYAPAPRISASKPKPVLPKALQKKYNSGGASGGSTPHSTSTGTVGQSASSPLVAASSNSNTSVLPSGLEPSGISPSPSVNGKDGTKDREGKEKEKAGSTWTPFNFVKSRTFQDDEPRPLKIVDIDPLELARQLTLIEFDLFASIDSFEFLEQAWMKEDRQVRAPNICQMAKWANHVVHWAVTEIVSVKDFRTRTGVYERFLMLASHLNALNNFNGVKEILAALQSSAIFRLKKTREGVGQKLLKTFDDLVRSTSSELNFKNLRAKVHAAEPPVIPFLGIYCSDLAFLDTCSKGILDGDVVSFHKYQKMASYIMELQVYQQTAYMLEPVPEIQDYIREFKVFDNEEAYAQSLICEAKI